MGLALLGAGTVKGAFGFGGASLAIPIMALFIDARDAVQVMILPVALGDVLSWISTRQGLRLDRRTWLFLIPVMVGSLPAAAVLSWLPERTVALMVGAVTVTIAAGRLRGLAFRLKPGAPRWITMLFGGTCGLITGATGMGGPLTIIYLSALEVPRETLIAALNITFIMVDVGRVSGATLGGGWERISLEFQMFTMVLVALGVGVGAWLRRRSPDQAFERGLNLFLSVTGLMLIYRALFA